MKKILLLMLLLALSGCKVDSWEQDAAKTACKDHKGVTHLNVGFLLDNSALCGDGAVIWLNSLRVGDL